MATCLVTGGAGFIGSHLVEALVRDGHSVRVLDDFSTGSRANLKSVEGSVELIIGDVGDGRVVRRAVAGADFIFHLAAVPSMARSVADPLETHRVCATGTLNVLGAALDARVQRVVYAATSSVYCPAPFPSREGDSPTPLAPYAVAKLVGEQYCRMFAEAYGLPTVCLRYFHVFGPRQQPGGPYAGAIPLFIDAMLDGRAPVIYGDGLQSRDFTYVDDVVRATRLAAVVPDAAGNTYNIGRGEPTSLLEVVAALNRILGTQIRPVFSPPRVADLRHSVADIACARADLGYEPTVELDDGLQRCVEFRRAMRPPFGPKSARSAAGSNGALMSMST